MKTIGRRAAVSVLAASLALPTIMVLGLAADSTQLWLMRQRLQWSVDASALLGASQLGTVTTANVQRDAKALFWANFGATQPTNGGFVQQVGFLGATATEPTVTVAPTSVTVQASATVKTLFMQALPVGPSKVVTASGTAVVPNNVEVSLVLDNSLSMNLPLTTSNSQTKLAALQIAAQNMLNTLFGSYTTSSNLSMSIVPFAGAVNVGSDHTGFVDATQLATRFPPTTNPDARWRGCVSARATPDDTNANRPTTSPFTPYFYASTKNVKDRPASLGGGYYPGDNDWTPAAGAVPASGITDTATASQAPNQRGGTLQAGPNLLCPHQALVPLTGTKATLTSAIANMTAVNGGGTVINQGLQWGWLTLAPSWSADWGLAPTVSGLARPLANGTANNAKIVVLMTDGINEIDGMDSWYAYASDGAGTNCNALSAGQKMFPECLQADSWYTSYGRLSEGRLVTPATTGDVPTNADAARASARTVLAQRMTTLCNNIKAGGNVQIYTIFYHGAYDDSLLNATTNGAGPNLQACATDSAHYFNSTSAAGINSAFLQIARDISNLRLSR